MKLALSYDQSTLPKGFDRTLTMVGDACLACEGIYGAYQVSLLVTDDHGIAAMNGALRGVCGPTDVLSFPSAVYPNGTARNHPKRLRQNFDADTGCVHLGDIVLSAPRAMEQAIAYGHAYLREIGFLFAHGMLHLLGYDHQTDAERTSMRAMEEMVMEQTGLVRKLPSEDQRMVDWAFEAMTRAYVPYSMYRVGACVRDSEGRLFKGCNVENASYGVTICAERNAISTAVTEGMKHINAIAIVIEQGMPTPCGACRQFMREFADDMKIILASRDGVRVTRLSALLPDSFGPESLEDIES